MDLNLDYLIEAHIAWILPLFVTTKMPKSTIHFNPYIKVTIKVSEIITSSLLY